MWKVGGKERFLIEGKVGGGGWRDEVKLKWREDWGRGKVEGMGRGSRRKGKSEGQGRLEVREGWRRKRRLEGKEGEGRSKVGEE